MLPPLLSLSHYAYKHTTTTVSRPGCDVRKTRDEMNDGRTCAKTIYQRRAGLQRYRIQSRKGYGSKRKAQTDSRGDYRIPTTVTHKFKLPYLVALDDAQLAEAALTEDGADDYQHDPHHGQDDE